MVRLAGASTRNRNRQLSNKYRLKVVHGDIEADLADVADEDGDNSKYTNLVAGVDAEDANVSPEALPANAKPSLFVAEHHLREVLHASSQHVHLRPTRASGATSNGYKAPQIPVFIPTPDSTGIVEQYSALYVHNRWKDPVTYLCTSTSPEESCNSALASDFTYYMDERDKEWLDKNNEAARGEGTSAQGAMSPSVARTSARSSKAKGKDPELLAISEDEFELVMGLFEKVTHDKTEYLHHGLENGMAFPAFSEYQDTFSSPLSPATFASFSVPHWIPTPSYLVSIARIVYQYWRERRTERGGHRIIPILNLDESDTFNESYVCFRRRETKTVRKTRASQATSSDKLIRLQAELLYPLELAKQLLEREQLKRDSALYSQQVWGKRKLLADFKRKFPAWGDEDENLLIDKDRPKRVELPRPHKIKSEVAMGASIRPEPIAMRPTERITLINDAVERMLSRQKEEGRQWEDEIDDPYQIPLVSHSTRCFKYSPFPLKSSSETREERVYRALRTRVGRGGRFLVDRRNSVTRSIVPTRRSLSPEADGVEETVEDDEQLKRMHERWRFDADDVPAVGPLGPDEINRVLVDDYSPRFLRHSMTFLLDPDQQNLINDPAIPVISNGRQQLVVPFKLGLPPAHRLAPGAPRPGVLQHKSPTPIVPIRTPISIQQQLKTMAPPSVPQMRISLNGGMRSNPVAMTGPPHLSQSSPPNSNSLARHSPSNSGIYRAAINLPHTDPSSAEVTGQSALNDSMRAPQSLQHDTGPQQDLKANDGAVTPVKLQGMAANKLTNSTTTPHTSPVFSNSTQPGMQGNHGLTALQMKNLKAAFASVQAQANQDTKGATQALPLYLQLGSPSLPHHQQSAGAVSSNINLKLPATRQMQWASGVVPSRSPVIDSQIPGPMSPSAVQVVPLSLPVNGVWSTMHIGSNGQVNHHMSPPTQHSTLPISATLVHSPPRVTPTPTLQRASPLLQHQQSAGNSKSGY
ncbi:hypothetical protein C0995_002159 [Termitomyces sp. Mi166|nr:hypothetical protein C0995_002159 [Termitomyces sp. Mi166\